MPTSKPPASERVVDAFRKLAASSKNLNQAVDEWKCYIAALNAALKKIDVGVPAWHVIAQNQEDNLDWWTREIGYTKIKDEWCIALRRMWGNLSHPDGDNEEIWRFEDAPRWVMVEAGGKIADLLETLVKRTDETTAKVNKRATETAEFATALAAEFGEPTGWIDTAIAAANTMAVSK
jgi:hypothetical protein